MPKYPPEIQAIIQKIDSRFPPHVWCDSGWFPLVISCHKALLEIDPDYKIQQIKEKFGLLRYYFTTDNPDLYPKMLDVVMEHGRISSTTCEITGKEGAVMHVRDHWLKTIHPDHAPDGYVPFVRKEENHES